MGRSRRRRSLSPSDSGRRYAAVRGRPAGPPPPDPPGPRGVGRDFGELREAYDRARLDSLLDGLTGLGNHRAFQEELDARIAQARDDGQMLALVMIDVDDLKTINDEKGHAAGDDLLRSVAQIMRANLRRGDGAYRTGGDEFALLLPACDAESAEVIANHLLASALSGHHGRSGAFSVTIGISAFPGPSADRHQIIHHADAALYAGKRHGRTNVQRFDPARHGIAEDSRSLGQLEAAVVRVATEDLLTAVYQPIYSLTTGRIVGFEGLVRPSPESGFSTPTSLFVAAEATRRTVELDVVCARAVLAGRRRARRRAATCRSTFRRARSSRTPSAPRRSWPWRADTACRRPSSSSS